MRIALACVFFLLVFTVQVCHAQTEHTSPPDSTTVDDSTDIKNLKWELSYDEFMEYYGTDDTSRALIHMFFRKRRFFGITTEPHAPLTVDESCCNVLGLYFTGSFSLMYFGIRSLVNCAKFTRQDLLYTLIDRENGYPLDDWYIKRLRNRDFGH